MAQVVIKCGGGWLAALLLLLTVSLHAQVSNDKLKKKITITTTGIRVDSFLNLVSRQTGLGFSFNSKKISPARQISLPKGTYTMAECLAEIQRVTGIHYAVMNNHIILVDNPPQERYRLDLGIVTKKKAPVVSKKPVVKPMVKHKPLVKPTPKPVATNPDTLLVTKDTLLVKDSLPVLKDSLFIDSFPEIRILPKKDSSIFAWKKRHRLRSTDWQFPALFAITDTGYYRRATQLSFRPIGYPGPSDSTGVTKDSTENDKQASAAKRKIYPPKGDPPAKHTATAPTRRSRREDRSTYKPGRSRPASSFNESEYDETKPSYHVGIVGLRPDIYDMWGIGINALYEHPLSNENWSVTASAGYHFLAGEYTSSKFKYVTDTSGLDSITVDTTLKNFAQIPVSVGIRCYLIRPLYAAVEIGYCFKASEDVSSSGSVAPSLGLKFPVGRKALDINFKYLYMLSRPTFEMPRLQKGNYGLWSLRVAYAF